MTPHHLMNPPDEPDIALHMPYLERCAAVSPFIIELGCGDGHGSMRALRRGHHGRVDFVNNFRHAFFGGISHVTYPVSRKRGALLL